MQLKSGTGLPRPGKNGQGTASVTIGTDGSIKVQAGDSISKYAKALYGDPLQGWEEFGRKQGGAIKPLPDPNKITAGETLYHLPTAGQGGGSQKAQVSTVLDGVALHRFIHSVAWRQALVQPAKLVWNGEKGSFLKTMGVDIFNLTAGHVVGKLPTPIWEPPFAEVHTPKTEDIRMRAEKLRTEYWSKFLARSQQGPAGAVQYLKVLSMLRESAMGQMNDLYKQAREINQGIENEIARSLKFLATTKLVADVTGTVLGLTPGGLLAKTAISLTFATINYAIQTRAATSDAEASASKQLIVAFSQSGADVASEGAEKISGRLMSVAGTHNAEAMRIAGELNKANQLSTEQLAKRMTMDHKINMAGQNAAKASYWKGGAAVLKTASFALAGYSIYLSYDEYKTTVGK